MSKYDAFVAFDNHLCSEEVLYSLLTSMKNTTNTWFLSFPEQRSILTAFIFVWWLYFISHPDFEDRRKSKREADVFCCICGCCPAFKQRQKITCFVNKMCYDYFIFSRWQFYCMKLLWIFVFIIDFMYIFRKQQVKNEYMMESFIKIFYLMITFYFLL